MASSSLFCKMLFTALALLHTSTSTEARSLLQTIPLPGGLSGGLPAIPTLPGILPSEPQPVATSPNVMLPPLLRPFPTWPLVPTLPSVQLPPFPAIVNPLPAVSTNPNPSMPSPPAVPTMPSFPTLSVPPLPLAPPTSGNTTP